MHHRADTAPERTSFGMGVVAVALGVGCGFVDSIARQVHRHDRADTEPTRGFAPPRQVHAARTADRRVHG